MKFKPTVIETGIIASIVFLLLCCFLLVGSAWYQVDCWCGLDKLARSTVIAVGKEVKQITKEIEEE